MKKFVEGKDFISCQVIPQPDGSHVWERKGEKVFTVHPSGRREEHRRAPFLSMSPCPYCGAEGDKVANVKHHNPLLHTVLALYNPV